MNNMRKVLLVNTPFYRLLGSHYNGLNLGIAYIAAVLRQEGHEVKIYNADYQDSENYANQRELIEKYQSYKEIMNNPDHPIWNEVVKNISSYGPDYVGFSLFTANIKAARIISRKLKVIDKHVKVVVGGDHPTLDPEGTIKFSEFDYLVFREGEYTMLELVNDIPRDKIAGLWYKKNGEIKRNPNRPLIRNIDTLPFPEREAFLNQTDKLDVGQVLTGRGCPNSCTFCASPRKWNRTTRFRSPENVITELEFIKKRYGVNLVYFYDDTLTLNKKRLKRLLKLMIERNLKINWKCDTRADCLDDELAYLMKQAGCIRAKIGVESGSDKILKKIKKNETTDQMREGIAYLKRYDIPITIYLMAGFPDETNEDLRQTIELAKELDVDYYSLSILAPYYGTEIYEELKAKGYNFGKDHWEYFYHQSEEMIVNNRIDPCLLEEFLALNELGKGGRV